MQDGNALVMECFPLPVSIGSEEGERLGRHQTDEIGQHIGIVISGYGQGADSLGVEFKNSFFERADGFPVSIAVIDNIAAEQEEGNLFFNGSVYQTLPGGKGASEILRILGEAGGGSSEVKVTAEQEFHSGERLNEKRRSIKHISL
jgi:hypothetical protein